MSDTIRQLLDEINQSLEDGGDRAETIVCEGFALIALLLRKNADYGDSAFQSPILLPGTPPRDAIQCRMSDKIERLRKLIESRSSMVNESLEDTMRDLAGYAILWLGAEE